MSLDESAPPALEIPEERGPSWRPWALATAIVAAMGLAAWGSGVRPSRLWTTPKAQLSTVEVDEGDVALVVTENGTLESADSSTVRCEVEALLGTTGTTGSRTGTTAGGQGSQAGAGGVAGAAGGAQGGTTPAPAPAAAKGKSQMGGASKAGGAKAKATGAGVASKTPTATPGGMAGAGGSAGAGAGAGASGGADASAGGGGSSIKRPDIQSFNYIVEPHIPLRGAKPPNTQALTKQQQAANQLMMQNSGRGGNSRGGSGGRGGSMGGTTEMPGSTRIISIIPEGSRVKAGDVVCELDSSAFVDELQAQRIRFIQAQSWVEQAKTILEVNQIAYREYREGIFPKDVQLVRQYIAMCKTQEERARKNLEWSKDAVKKGFRSHAQLQADSLAYGEARFALTQAEGMMNRLTQFTEPRIMKARLAKIEAIKADLASQEAAFQLESTRLRRLEKMVANCTLRAPRDGLVVYANQSNSWGRSETQIQEGVTVRQSQPIFNVPDPKHMRVKARVNESKTSLVQEGQKVIIRVDAFPRRPLRGTVGAITAIPAPANIANLDVQVYFATVNLDTGGFDELRPGLSAEVSFLVERHTNVTRVPLEAIRWVDDQPYVALTHATPEGMAWRWTPVSLGLSDARYAEVRSGLKRGDRVIAQPNELPRPSHPIARTPTERDQATRS